VKRRNLAIEEENSSLLPCGVEEETGRKKKQGDAETESEAHLHTEYRKRSQWV